jgi:glycosyltransferase involved in cell wall biosynthesis
MRSLSKRPRVVIVTDAWTPQVNGVVRTLVNTRAQLHALGVHVDLITPQQFMTIPCPGYAEIRLSLARSSTIGATIDDLCPDALHIATEGPLGWAARSAALRRGWAFTTAYHTRFPEYVHARTGLPESTVYGLLRRFHAPASKVLVPTTSMIADLRDHGFAKTTLWSRGVDHNIFFPRRSDQSQSAEHPIFLYAGRLSKEKNIEAFLRLDLPGEKWVAGGGPLEGALKRRYRDVRWIGQLSQHELASVYSKANVFVFPSRTDTFGLVMLEAMACGLPVAAFPVAGPNDVVGSSGAGVLSNDLRAACLDCLSIPRDIPIAHAARYTWHAATQQFWDALFPIRQPAHRPSQPQSSGLASHVNSQ